MTLVWFLRMTMRTDMARSNATLQSQGVNGVPGATLARGLNGTTQGFTVAHNVNLRGGNDEFGLLCVWKPLDIIGAQRIFSKYGGAGNREYIFLQQAGSLDFFVSNDGTATVSVSSSVTVVAGQWQFALAYHDSVADVIAILHNGTLTTLPHTTGVFAGGTATFDIARTSAGTDELAGSIGPCAFVRSPTDTWQQVFDKFRNANKGRLHNSLSAAEIAAMGLVSWWDMDATSGNESDEEDSNLGFAVNSPTSVAGPGG
jgi:hypothetical protein